MEMIIPAIIAVIAAAGTGFLVSIGLPWFALVTAVIALISGYYAFRDVCGSF